MATVLNDVGKVAKDLSINSKVPALFVLTSDKRIEKISLWSPAQIYRMVCSALKGTIRFRWSRCGSANIKVNNNIIAFYPKANIIIKIFGTKEALKRHLNGVNTFLQLNTKNLQATKIINIAENSVPFSVEQLLESKKTWRYKLSEQEIEDLARFHLSAVDTQHQGFTEDKKNVISRAINRFEFSPEQRRYFNYLIQNKNLLLKGPVHGDLSYGNIIDFSGRKILIDWECFSSNGLVGYDVAKLWIQSDREIRARILNKYSTSISKIAEKYAIEYSFAHQLIIGLLLHLYELHTKTSSYWRSIGKTKKEIMIAVARGEESIKEGLDSLYIDVYRYKDT